MAMKRLSSNDDVTIASPDSHSQNLSLDARCRVRIYSTVACGCSIPKGEGFGKPYRLIIANDMSPVFCGTRCAGPSIPNRETAFSIILPPAGDAAADDRRAPRES